ncbi:Trihelix transcription factor ASIL1 [Hirschfeldia incana]|nr:Trihelix transcription factor ASIL1 [Hirschfeldia incana]
MEEEDSPKSPGESSSPAPPSPPPPILPTNDVTVAASATKPPQSPSRNALAVHTPSAGNRNGGRSGGGGGRDDCWSEEATKVLIEAWGERFSEPGKGTLKQQQWKEVAEVVNESRQCKYLKTDVQCKNRIDTVKKKYKLEKAKIASGDGPSKWVFFKKLEALIGGGNNAKAQAHAPPMGRRQGKGTGTGSDSMRWHFRKRSASETESESDPEPDDSAESLPPSSKRLKMMDEDEETGGRSGAGDVAKAIVGFTEAYEKAETAKLKLMMELEKERMKFVKEMELQRMQFLKTRMEMTQKDQEEEEEEERSKPRRINDDDDDDRNVKNNGDVSS